MTSPATQKLVLCETAARKPWSQWKGHGTMAVCGAAQTPSGGKQHKGCRCMRCPLMCVPTMYATTVRSAAQTYTHAHTPHITHTIHTHTLACSPLDVLALHACSCFMHTDLCALPLTNVPVIHFSCRLRRCTCACALDP